MHPINPSGAPAFIAASFNILAVSIIHFFAFGCGEITIPFPAFNAINILYIVEDVGFVEGINPAITPTGTATSQTLFSLSSL